MSATSSRPASSVPGSKTTPGFNAPHTTVASAWTASPRTAPDSPSTPEGMSIATTGTAPALRSRIARRCARRRSVEPGPEDRVDRDVGAGELPLERVGADPPAARVREPLEVRPGRPRERAGLLEQDDRHAHARPLQQPGGHQPVAPVVALAAHDHGAAPVRAAGGHRGGPGDGRAGRLHQRRHVHAGLGARAIERGGLGGREDREHQPIDRDAEGAGHRPLVRERHHHLRHAHRLGLRPWRPPAPGWARRSARARRGRRASACPGRPPRALLHASRAAHRAA